jgi:membrane protein YqaA with SNARE-associated domain
VNWLLGRYLIHFRHRRWFPVKPALLDRATAWYQTWGFWSLLLAWAPFIGDPLTLVAGILRENFWVFLALVTLGKAARYIAVVMAV